jgi:hypothetical protein
LTSFNSFSGHYAIEPAEAGMIMKTARRRHARGCKGGRQRWRCHHHRDSLFTWRLQKSQSDFTQMQDDTDADDDAKVTVFKEVAEPKAIAASL